MPVVRLSRMMTVIFALLYTASIRPVMPLWMKVESPMTATECLCASGSALSNPIAMPMLAPMHTTTSIAESGGTAPSV